MRYLKLILVFIFCLLLISEVFAGSGVEISVKTGMDYRFKESFRNSYDQTLFCSEKEIPLSIGLDAEYLLWDDIGIAVEHDWTRYTLSTNDKIYMNFLSTIILGRYYFGQYTSKYKDLNPYLELGLGYYLIDLNTYNFWIDELGTELGPYEKSQLYQGLGLRVGFGLKKYMSEKMFIGIRINSELNYLGKADEGGLGNMGGLSAVVNLGYIFKK